MPGTIHGVVKSIDATGNLVTDIPADSLANAPTDESIRIECDEHETLGLYRAYDAQPPMTLMAVLGQSGHLELVIVGDSAAMMLGVRLGTKVTVRW